MASLIKVAVIDDHLLFRKGIISLLENYKSELEILFESSNGKEMIESIESGLMPDVVLLDIDMPVMNGIDAIVNLKRKFPSVNVVVLTMHDQEEMVIHMIEKGAKGFIPKNERLENVINAIKTVNQNKYYFNEKLSLKRINDLINSGKIEPKIKGYDLSDKEIEIIKLICKQLTNKEIADFLNLSPRTIDGHRERILKKIGAKNTAGIVLFALKMNLIS
jgi:two-component system, NarL family, response regulator DegU